ncbi:MAG: 6-carboxytetrahydropterin synthase [Acidobacteriota bacterium]|nr:6-carboxytetrahydropterin synthase [Acidobacteriota bacterium]
MIYLTRRAEFSAAHFYHVPQWSDAENQRRFGKCANRNGHGHNYTLEVTVCGEVDAVTGFVIDLKHLKDILQRSVLDDFDHRHLNHEVAEFAAKVPTTENLSVAIWQRLQPHLAPARLHRVRLYEMPDLFVDYYGE